MNGFIYGQKMGSLGICAYISEFTWTTWEIYLRFVFKIKFWTKLCLLNIDGHFILPKLIGFKPNFLWKTQKFTFWRFFKCILVLNDLNLVWTLKILIKIILIIKNHLLSNFGQMGGVLDKKLSYMAFRNLHRHFLIKYWIFKHVFFLNEILNKIITLQCKNLIIAWKKTSF